MWDPDLLWSFWPEAGCFQQGGWITGADQKEAGATQESTDSAGTAASLEQKKVDTKIKKMGRDHQSALFDSGG